MMRGHPIRYGGPRDRARFRRRDYVTWAQDMALRMLTGRRTKALRPAPSWQPWRWQRGE